MVWLVNRYTRPGEVVLDPMAGAGSTAIAASLLRRDSVMVEVEKEFADQIFEMMTNLASTLIADHLGDIRLIRGDSRKLSSLLGNLKVDHCIFSPPYGNILAPRGREGARLLRRLAKERPYAFSYIMGQYGYRWPGNVGTVASYAQYLEEMEKIYRSIHEVLPENGNMVLITRNFLVEQQEIFLDQDTISMCEQIGFELFERHAFEVPKNIFRAFHEKLGHKWITEEDILAFRRKRT
jgi:DNA modification methylase